MNSNEKALKLGAIIQNFMTESEDKRNSGVRSVYNYQMSGTIVRRKWFQMVFNVSTAQIDRLQECIKHRREFKIKKKGNNSLPTEM